MMISRKMPGIILAAALLVMAISYKAHSYTELGVLQDDGSVSIEERFDDGSVWFWHYDKDGNCVEGYEVNPNPDDGGGGGAPTSDAIKDALKRHYKGTLSKGVQTNNPFITKQSSHGKGLAPRWNPSDRAREYDISGGSGGSGPGSNSGSTSEWVKSMAKRGSNGDNDDDNDRISNKDKPELGTTGSIKPERINPIPFNSSAAHKTLLAKSQKRVSRNAHLREAKFQKGAQFQTTQKTGKSIKKVTASPKITVKAQFITVKKTKKTSNNKSVQGKKSRISSPQTKTRVSITKAL